MIFCSVMSQTLIFPWAEFLRQAIFFLVHTCLKRCDAVPVSIMSPRAAALRLRPGIHRYAELACRCRLSSSGDGPCAGRGATVRRHVP